MTIDPEDIPDADHESVIDRVCAIDVAKASGKVCVRIPHPSVRGRRTSKVWDVPATCAAVTELAEQLLAERVERVTVESTSDYWRIWLYLLEAAGLGVQLVNARDVKNVPGRPKTDKLDAVWLAKLTEKGMLRPSFVPPADIRQLRDYTRLRIDLTRERTRYWQRMEKLLEDALIKVSSVASTMTAKSVRDMLEALIAGERNPQRLADYARGRMQAKRGALIEALSGRFEAHHGVLARVLLNQIDVLNAEIAALTERINDQLAAITAVAVPQTGGDTLQAKPAATGVVAVQRLCEVTGIGELTAQVIIAEIGIDMTRFPTAAHLVSWAKLSPRTVQSQDSRHRGGSLLTRLAFCLVVACFWVCRWRRCTPIREIIYVTVQFGSRWSGGGGDPAGTAADSYRGDTDRPDHRAGRKTGRGWCGLRERAGHVLFRRR